MELVLGHIGTRDRKLVFRSILEMLALLVLLVAICLGVLRFTFVNLGMFEDRINENLEYARASVVGLEGSWSGITPVVHIQRLSIGNSHFDGVIVRIDLVETLLRSKFIAEWIHIGSGDLIFEYGLHGWGLVSNSDDLKWLNLRELFWHSDRIDIRTRVHFLRAGSSYVGEVKIDANNSRGRHRHEMSFRPMVGCGSCGGSVLLDLQSDNFWGGSFSGALKGSLKSLEIDRALVGLQDGHRIEFSVSGAATVQQDEWKWRTDVEFDFATTQETNLIIAGLRGYVKDDKLVGQARFRAEPSSSAALPTVNFEFDEGQALMWSRDVVYLSTLLAHSELALARSPLLGKWIAAAMPKAEIHSMSALLDEVGPVVHLRLRDFSIQPVRNTPGIQVEASDVFLTDRAMEMAIGGSAMSLAMPEHFDREFVYESVQGKMFLFLGAEHLGVQSKRFIARSGSASLSGAFGSLKPLNEQEFQFVLELSSEFLPHSVASDFLSTSLAPGLRNWILSSVINGELRRPSALFCVSKADENMPNQVSMDFRSEISKLQLRYAEDWPDIQEGHGKMLYTKQGFSANASSLKSYGEQVRDLVVSIPKEHDRIDIRFVTDTDLSKLIQFVRETPLREQMQWMAQEWGGEGDTRVETTLSLDLENDIAVQDFGVHLAVSDARFAMQDLDLNFTGLRGDLFFESPYRVKTNDLRGKLFDEPASIAIESVFDSNQEEPEFVDISVAGRAESKDVWERLDISDPGFATGIADYIVGVRVPFDETEPVIIEATSDLTGVGLDLPLPYAKLHGDQSSLRLRVLQLDSHVSIEAEFADVTGWVEMEDGQVLQGSIGVGIPAISIPKDSDKIWLTGYLDESALTVEMSEGAGLGMPLQLFDFKVDALKIGLFELTDVVLNGSLDSLGADFALRSNELDARVRKTAEEPMSLSEAHLRISANDSEEDADPLPLLLLDELIPISVSLESSKVLGLDGSETDYGSWSFSVWPDQRGARIDDLKGVITGMSVEASEPMWWLREQGQSSFTGSVVGAGIGEVFDAWDIDLNIESANFAFTGDVRWNGSPLAIGLEKLSGDVEMELLSGRLLDIDQVNRSVRLSSLLNFSTFIRRLEGKFADVTGEGLSFNRIHAHASVKDGLVTFTEPGYLDGTGVVLRATGRVDLPSGEIDVNVAVTLGLDKSLPWYTTYLLMTNPMAGAGVFIGSQVLGSAIKDLLSMQYRLTGTLDEPDIELIKVFDKGLEKMPDDFVEEESDQDGVE